VLNSIFLALVRGYCLPDMLDPQLVVSFSPREYGKALLGKVSCLQNDSGRGFLVTNLIIYTAHR
jgi:hypothetical protein